MEFVFVIENIFHLILFFINIIILVNVLLFGHVGVVIYEDAHACSKEFSPSFFARLQVPFECVHLVFAELLGYLVVELIVNCQESVVVLPFGGHSGLLEVLIH